MSTLPMEHLERDPELTMALKAFFIEKLPWKVTEPLFGSYLAFTFAELNHQVPTPVESQTQRAVVGATNSPFYPSGSESANHHQNQPAGSKEIFEVAERIVQLLQKAISQFESDYAENFQKLSSLFRWRRASDPENLASETLKRAYLNIIRGYRENWKLIEENGVVKCLYTEDQNSFELKNYIYQISNKVNLEAYRKIDVSESLDNQFEFQDRGIESAEPGLSASLHEEYRLTVEHLIAVANKCLACLRQCKFQNAHFTGSEMYSILVRYVTISELSQEEQTVRFREFATELGISINHLRTLVTYTKHRVARCMQLNQSKGRRATPTCQDLKMPNADESAADAFQRFRAGLDALIDQIGIKEE